MNFGDQGCEHLADLLDFIQEGIRFIKPQIAQSLAYEDLRFQFQQRGSAIKR
jgi:hypothetical protein